jgi:two-component system sensor histidine kinase CssS
LNLQNRPLAVQIWLVFGFTLIAPFLLLSLAPWVIPSLFTPAYHETIERAQDSIVKSAVEGGITPEDLQALGGNLRHSPRLPMIHLLIHTDGTVISSSSLDNYVISAVKEHALVQKKDLQHYESRLGGSTYFYVLRRLNQSGGVVFLASLMTDVYTKDMIDNLFIRFIPIIGFILLLCWFPSILLARYLSRPLVQLEQHVQQIAGLNWHQPIKVDRQDEIGRLAASVERMREKLAQQDEAQQSFLQNLSHDLKTPVMVVRSYAQSIIDGVYPQGDLAGSVKIIELESQRLEKRIQNLLYLTKIDYLSTHAPLAAKAELHKVLDEVISRFRWRRGEIEWSIELAPLSVAGAAEKWTVVFENLLDNQLRYAANRVEVSLKRQNPEGGEIALVRIWNDGPAISEPDIEKLFRKFQRGSGGEFGLGLSIVQRIVSAYGGKVWVVNEDGGVAFYLSLQI